MTCSVAEGQRVGWNYRVMRHQPDPARGEAEEWFAIHEVYYRSDDVDDRTVDSSETRYTVDAITPRANNVDELRWLLEQMLAALDKPILEFREGPDASPDRQ